MDADLQKAAAFVNRLLMNPALGEFSPLQKEDQILQFLELNGQQLYATLAASVFPGMAWSDMYQRLVEALMAIVDSMIEPELGNMVRTRFDQQFLTHLLTPQVPNVESYCSETLEFLKRILRKNEVRRDFTGPFTAAMFKLTDRYLSTSFERRTYVFVELTKVQKLRMGSEEIKSLVLNSLLLKSSVYLLVTQDPGSAREDSPVVQGQLVSRAYQTLSTQLRHIPASVLEFALASNTSFIDNPRLAAVSRVAAIFAARGKMYKPMARRDRGADTPDKSWFNIARRNYRYYGFDIKMLDEFYNIAADSGW